LIRKITDCAYNLQVCAIKCIKEFLAKERELAFRRKIELERQGKEKDRILRRIMSTSLRFAGMAFNQSYAWTIAARKAEIVLTNRRMGIMRRIVDSNTRLASAGYNKLLEVSKARKAMLKNKLRFVILALTDSDAGFKLAAYNGLKQRALMLNGVGCSQTQMKKVSLIKRIMNKGYSQQVMGINSMKAYLKFEREREEEARLEHERCQKEKDRTLRRIMDTNLRMASIVMRQAHKFMEKERQLELIMINKQRGIMRRILDSNTRMMSAGYNKLCEEAKARKEMLRNKMKWVIKALTDTDAQYILSAYNGLKQRYQMLCGVGMGDAQMKKVNLIKRLMNKGHNLQIMAINSVKEFLTNEREEEDNLRLEFERQMREKDRILRRIMDINLRFEGMAFRQALQWMEADREKERILVNKQRGVMNRILDSNTRLMSAGWNKLLEEAKTRRSMCKNKLKYVIKSLTDKDARAILTAYNELKQRYQMLCGVGMGDAQMKKVSLIKRMMNKGHNLQIMAINSIKQFLYLSRDDEEKARCEFERQQKERARILRRIMNTNLRFEGIAFRQAYHWMEAERKRETIRVNRQRGVMMRILDSNTRLISAGWNKLLEEAKARRSMCKNKLRYVIKSLTDKDSAMTLAAYNALKQRRLMLMGVGMGDASLKKINLIKRITNKSHYLQVMAINALKTYLALDRDFEEKLRQEHERQQKEKDRILKRVMNIN